ncbi:MAG: 2TM domain-containing protein [Actinomycetota bacterium]|nr:2TM domain-containing protein [Actinomycetota bacterium]
MEAGAEMEEEQTEYARVQQQKKEEAVRVALGKFNFFLHLTFYLSCCLFLVILAILMRNILPYLLIPVVIWTFVLIVHFRKAFFSQKNRKEKAKH